MKTMGSRITKLGRSAASAPRRRAPPSAHRVVSGVPASTTHTITGAIMGVGAAHRVSAVRWGIARILWAWILTIPASAGIGGLTYVVLHAIVG